MKEREREMKGKKRERERDKEVETDKENKGEQGSDKIREKETDSKSSLLPWFKMMMMMNRGKSQGLRRVHLYANSGLICQTPCP